jgi:hypothetical protein
MKTTELYQKFLQEKGAITNAINRLDQRHTDAVEQSNSAALELSNALKSWALGTMEEDVLETAHVKAGSLKSMANPEPFRFAKESLETEIEHLDEAYQKSRKEAVTQEREAEYKLLFNTAVTNGKKLTNDEEIKLKSTVTEQYVCDLNKLFPALNDYCFKFNRHPTPPTFQEYSKIDYYPI